MARLVECEAWAEPNSLAMHLHYDLPGDYVVVDAPTVRGHELDVVVVGPQGLFVLHEDGTPRGERAQREAANPEAIPVDMVAGEAEEAEGEPAESEARTEPAADAKEPGGRADERVRSATRALNAFLKDEFPTLTPQIHHLRLLGDPDADREDDDVPTATARTVVDRIGSTEAPEGSTLLDPQTCAVLAVALRDRRLTASRRASQPFIFRSGHALSTGTEVWTIREAVRHMDQDPESGVYHLQNGTLADWFHEEGAEHMAKLARDVTREDTDRRVALETFLLKTGLVSRPKLEVKPKEVDLGYALAGDSVARRIRVGKGPGRGCLFGRLEPSVPWLSVHPREFKSEDRWTVVSVRADTQALPITQRPRKEAVYIHSNASEEPVPVAVRLQVVGLPSPLNRHLLRPAVGLAAAGPLGALVGWLLTARGVPGADLLNSLAWLPVPPGAVWVLFFTLLWASLGAVRGATQPRAWPIRYAIARWLVRIAIWTPALALTGAAARWGWAGLRGPELPPIPSVTAWVLAVGPMGLSIVPATIGEMRSAREMRETSARAIRWSFLRPLLLPVGALFLTLAVRLGAPQLRALWERVGVSTALGDVGSWIADRVEQLESFIENIIDELYLLYYES